MVSYLVLDTTSNADPSFMNELAVASAGQLALRDLGDALVRMLLARSQGDFVTVPALIELNGEEERVFTGHGLQVRLVTLLGPRRAWQVSSLIARAQTPYFAATTSRRGILAAGASLAAGTIGLTLLAPRSTAAQPLEAASSVATPAAAKGGRPGRHSRQIGVTSWRVRKTSSGYVVRFEHQRNRSSGTLSVNFGNQRRTASTVLTRGRKRFQLVYSGRQLAATSANGQSMVARYDDNRRRWEADSQSKRRFEENKTDVNISLAIAGDLGELNRPRRASSKQGLSNAASCGTTVFTGRADGVSESLACDWATINVNQECDAAPPSPCHDCCRVVEGCDCDCVGFFLPWINANLACHCTRHGYDYGGNGFC